jgi:hypothetical protein
MAITLSPQEREDADYVESLAPERGAHVLDLSEERQYRHVVAVHNRLGQTAEKCPGLHAALAEARDTHSNGVPTLPSDPNWVSDAIINSVGKTPSGAAGAQGFVSVIGGGMVVYAGLEVEDMNGNVLASAEVQDYGKGTYLPLKTNDKTASPATDQMQGKLYATVIGPDGHTIIPVAAREVPGLMVGRDPAVTEPVLAPTHRGNPAIIIGLGRGPIGRIKADVDYWFWQAQDKTEFAIPLVATIVYDQECDPNSFRFAAWLTRGDGRGGTHYLNQPIRKNIDSASQVSILMNAYKSDGDNQDNPMNFGSVPWDADDLTFLTVKVTMTSTSGVKMDAIIASAKTVDQNILDGITFIPPIAFTWHCLPLDTPTLMAEGSLRAIGELRAGDELMGPDGSHTVRTLNAARHDGSLTSLRLDDGSELHLTDSHVVMTPDGERQAGRLAPGDAVNVVRGGTAAIEDVSTVHYRGVLCNVGLGAGLDDALPAEHTFFAGGVEVGDVDLQVGHRERLLADPAYVRSKLSPRFLPDYENWLASRAPA